MLDTLRRAPMPVAHPTILSCTLLLIFNEILSVTPDVRADRITMTPPLLVVASKFAFCPDIFLRDSRSRIEVLGKLIVVGRRARGSGPFCEIRVANQLGAARALHIATFE